MNRHILMSAILCACASSASAKALPDLKSVIGSLEGEYLTYGGPYGHRMAVNAQTRIDAGATKLAFVVSQGTRKAGDESFHGTRVQASLVHDWTPRLSTRTTAGIGSNAPVFVNRELGQELSYKVLPATVVTAGGRYARYFGDVDSRSWSLGAAQYFSRGYVSYRFSKYDTKGLGHSLGHLVSGKLNDRYGATQIWLGHGTALHDATWLGVPQKGKFTQVEIQRIQPLGGGASLNIGVNRSWNETASTRFHGNGIRMGLTFGK